LYQSQLNQNKKDKMAVLDREYTVFKKAVILSITAHLLLLILIIISPHLPKSSQKGMIHYVNLISFSGGGGPGGGGSGGGIPGGIKGTEEKTVETAVPPRESLKDLTTLQKFQQETPSSLRFPVEKPKKDKETISQKKAVIQKPPVKTSKSQAASKTSGSGTGSGLKLGIGGGPGGSGSGGGYFSSEYSSQIGLSNFPFTYYLQIIHSKISSNWFISQISPGIKGTFHTTVYFKIHRDGHISGLEIKESSGIRSLDLSALRAVQSAGAFPPLPNDYEDEYLIIRLIFEHNK